MTSLQKRIEAIAADIDGRMGVCVRDLKTSEEIGMRLDELLPMASVCKIPVLVTAYLAHDEGRLDLSARIEFTEACRCFGSGLFNAFDPGFNPTIHDLLLMMIVVSDNAATDLIINQLTPNGITAAMRTLGHGQIHVNRDITGLIGDILAALDPRCKGVPYPEWDALLEANPDIKELEHDLDADRRAVNIAVSDRDVATVRSIARLCTQIANKECATAESCDAMLAILEKQQLNGRLPRDLPAFVKFPHKTGTLGSGAVVNDAGILFLEDEPVAAVAVLSRDVRNPIHETNTAIATIGRAVFDHFQSR